MSKPIMPQTTVDSHLELTSETYYGMSILKIEGRDYAVGTLEQTEIAARLVAKESLELIEPEILIQHSCLPPQAVDLVRLVQEECWGSFHALYEVITDIDALVEASIAAQGKTLFLSIDPAGVEYSLSDFSQYRDSILNGLGLPCSEDVRLYCLA